jgi:3-oxoacyl-[acyl-carrier protein] reductase
MLGRDLVALESRRESIESELPGASLFAIEANVCDPESVKIAFQRIFREHRELHVLVANAGVLEDALIGMVTSDQIERVFSTNAFGVIYCCQYASRLMARTGGGSIVNVSSIVGSNGNAGQSVYAGSKAAVIGITHSLAKELASANIRVNAVAPGLIDTEMIRSLPTAQFQERKNSIKIGRVGTPEEVADVILFLSSDMSRYVTGQVIGVDGGMLI